MCRDVGPMLSRFGEIFFMVNLTILLIKLCRYADTKTRKNNTEFYSKRTI